MTDKPDSHDDLAGSDDTLTVAPPGFRERVAAAQKAKTTEIRQSVEIPNPLLKRTGALSASQNPAPPKAPENRP